MYMITIDGQTAYSTMDDNEAHIALNVKPTLDIEDSGSLSFVLPPGNAQYDAIRKMKSIVTLYQDDVLLFRGRVTECEKYFYNQKSVYCEGDRSFLNDSLWEEQTVTGNAQDLFRSLIENHNQQVDEEKRFTVGVITAVDEDEPYEGEQRIETRRHWDTASILNDRLLSVYGGYIRTRTEGGTTYIDWIADFEEESSQTIAFSVNLLDLTDKMDASDVFTCLIPLGYSEIGEDGTYEDPVNIKSVNGGRNYIQDDEAVAKYGKIWRSKTWGNTKDPAELLSKGWEYLRTGGELRTLTIKAVDMHLTSGQIEMIRIGTKVHIESDPHGIALQMVCAKIDPDIDNPENTTYTFGVKPRTLTEAVIRNEKETSSLTGKGRGGGGGGGKSVEEELSEILRWAKINVDEANSQITANAGKIDTLTGNMSSVELILNGDEGDAGLIAKTNENTAAIELNTDEIGSLTTIKADVVYVDAEITEVEKLVADEIDAAISDISLSIGETVVTEYLTVTDKATIDEMALGGSNVSKTALTVVTEFTQASGETAETKDVTVLTTAVGDDTRQDIAAGETVTF